MALLLRPSCQKGYYPAISMRDTAFRVSRSGGKTEVRERFQTEIRENELIGK